MTIGRALAWHLPSVGLCWHRAQEADCIARLKASTILGLALIMLGIMAFACQVTT